MFSVIIPLYNKENSIEDTIQSVLDQTFKDFELVIVNDGSTDGSLQKVKEIKDLRIKLVDKVNGGVSSARNRGIREASNDWLTFLDGDDIWHNNHLEEYAKVISNNKLNWLLSGYISKKGAKDFSFLYNVEGILKNAFDDLLIGLKIHTSTVCAKRILFMENSELFFREGINNSEDREVWYKLCGLDQNPYYIKKALSFYMLDDSNSLTKGGSSDHFLTVLERISESNIYLNMSDDNRNKLKKYINNFNKKSIKGLYIRRNKLESQYRNYFSNIEWRILDFSSNFPVLFKKIIARYFL